MTLLSAIVPGEMLLGTCVLIGVVGLHVLAIVIAVIDFVDHLRGDQRMQGNKCAR